MQLAAAEVACAAEPADAAPRDSAAGTITARRSAADDEDGDNGG